SDGGNAMDAAARVLDGAALDLGCRANLADTLRGQPADAQVDLSQMVSGQDLHGLVRGTIEMAPAVAAALEQPTTAASPSNVRTALAPPRLVRLRGRWLTRGMSTHAAQPEEAGVCGTKENRAAVVCHHAAAYGHGVAVGFSHRLGQGQRTAAPGGDVAELAVTVAAGRGRGLHRLRLLSSHRGRQAELLDARRRQRAYAGGSGLRRARRSRHRVPMAGEEDGQAARGDALDRVAAGQKEDVLGHQCARYASLEHARRRHALRNEMGRGSILSIGEADI